MAKDTEPIPKYYLAPNFSIPPADCGGLLHLGSLITSISNADDVPINADCRQNIPESSISQHRKNGFTAIRSQMVSGSVGIEAKLVAMNGVGGELSWAPERTEESVYRFDAFDTVYFTPTQQYLDESMNQQDVNEHVVRTKYDPIYMITGLKIARRPSVKISKSKAVEFKFGIGLQQPEVLPISVGSNVNASRDSRIQDGFEGSDDFVLGIRVKKLVYKRHWLTRVTERIDAREYNKGATMYDDDGEERPKEEVVDLGDEYGTGAVTQTEVQVEPNGQAVQEIWICN